MSTVMVSSTPPRSAPVDASAWHTPAVIVVEVVAWVAIAVMAAVLITQAAGWSRTTLVVSLQAVTPYLLAFSVPIGLIAVVTGRWYLAAAAGAIAAALVALGTPLGARSAKPPAADNARTLRVFHGNLMYYNGRTAELARVVAALDADVLAFTEYTPTHAGGLYVGALAGSFPFRLEHPEATAGGSAIWSRHRLTEIPAPPALYRSTAALIDVADGVELYVVHPPNPLENLGHWRDELDGFAGLHDSVDRTSMLVGDFNATFWHPPFRRLGVAGWRDAHQVGGRGFSSSWPNDKSWLPPLLRLDHALVDESVEVIDVVDVDLPGSDHRGFVVTVAVRPTAPAGRVGRSRRPRAATDGSSTASSPRRAPAARTTSPGSTAGAPSPLPDR
jgi:endonuclease/exonuclease/phosphatase (EEP) superfamily protein YafD